MCFLTTISREFPALLDRGNKALPLKARSSNLCDLWTCLSQPNSFIALQISEHPSPSSVLGIVFLLGGAGSPARWDCSFPLEVTARWGKGRTMQRGRKWSESKSRCACQQLYRVSPSPAPSQRSHARCTLRLMILGTSPRERRKSGCEVSRRRERQELCELSPQQGDLLPGAAPGPTWTGPRSISPAVGSVFQCPKPPGLCPLPCNT